MEGSLLVNWEKFNIKTLLLSRINRKLTILFLIVGLLAPTIAIYYFYNITNNYIHDSIPTETTTILKTIALIVIILIAVDAGIIGYFISRSISRPIKKLYNATKQVEKGNYDIRLEITTGDEIEKLGNAFNETTLALGKMQEERDEIDNAKTEFLSITSHELKSPMTPMKAQLQMLEGGYFGKLNKNQKESIAIITRNADRLDKIIQDFLEISRIESARLKFNFRKTNLLQLVKDTVKFMEGLANEKNIKFELNINKLPIIEADPDRISQVLRNIINNAIKFSKKNSKIEVSAHLNPNNIQFSVIDTGVGLTPENQIRIFEPFYQVENSNRRCHGGTGLGLAICRGIVESQNGKIWVESKPEAGSKFNFTVPFEPVRKIKPIKVLFSQKEIFERKILEEFQTELGPLGQGEFDELKSKNEINKDDLFEYVDFLTKKFIISIDHGLNFKNKINKIFGEEKETINNKINKEYAI
jgi:signal transduction histidine kinase